MFKSLIFASLLAAGSAHQNFHQFWVNDVSPGFEVGVRMPPSNSPVVDVTSNDIVCNVPGTNAPAGGVATVPVAAGDKITVQWDQSGHPGPISHMLFGPIDSAALATGVGEWFKIDELTSVSGKWANEIMGAAEMKHSFTLPANLASGEYLLRSEMLALHGANTLGGAQFYIGCAQIKVTGPGGSCGPKITLPGAYDPEEAGIYIPNVYNGFDLTTYAAPGGAIAVCAAGSGGSAPVATSKPAVSSAASSSAVVSSAPIVSTSVSAPSSSTAVEEPISSTTAATLAVTSTTAIPAVTPVSTTTLAPVSTTLASVASSTKTACKVKSSTTAVPVVPASSSTKSACKPKATSTGVPATLPSSTAPVAIPSASAPVATPSASAAPVSSVASIYAQCGGVNYTGPTVCAAGATCVKSNDFYSQCLRGA